MPIGAGAGGGFRGIGRLEAYLGLNNAAFLSGMAQANASMQAAAGRMRAFDATMRTYVILPMAIAVGASVKMATSYEKTFSEIEGLVGIAADKVAEMKEETLALAGPTSRSPQELGEALYFVTSAGLRGADAMAVLEQSARASAAGLGETKIVADLVTSAVNAYGIATLSAAAATDTLVATVREGKATAASIAPVLGYVLPISSALGVSFQEVGAAVASMTRTGTDASTAVVQLRQILASILDPASQSEEALRSIGVSGAILRETLRGEGGLLKVLQFLSEEMKTNEQIMAKVFPNIRALAGALDIMGANASENVEIFRRMKDNTGDADKAFEAAAKTTEFKFNQALADLKVIMIDFGTAILPTFNEALKGVTTAIDNGKEAADRYASSLETLRKLILLVLPTVQDPVGPVLEFRRQLEEQFRKESFDIPILFGKAQEMGPNFSMGKGFWAEIGEGAVAALPPIKKVFEVTKEMLDKMNDIKWDAIHAEKAAEETAVALSEAAMKATMDFYSLATTIEGVNVLLGNQMELDYAQWFQEEMRKTNEAVDNSEKHIFRYGEAIKGMFADAFASFGEVLGEAIAGGGLESILSGILSIVADFGIRFGKMMVAYGGAWLKFREAYFDPTSAIIAGIAIIAISSAIKNFAGKGVQGMASGGYVQQGGVFQLHKDEMVSLPAGAAVTPAWMAKGRMQVEVIGQIEGYVIAINQKKQQYERSRIG